MTVRVYLAVNKKYIEFDEILNYSRKLLVGGFVISFSSIKYTGHADLKYIFQSIQPPTDYLSSVNLNVLKAGSQVEGLVKAHIKYVYGLVPDKS